MAVALVNGQVWWRGQFHRGLAVVMDAGRITAIVAEDEVDCGSALDMAGDRLLPGLIDVQVNGGGGVLFNDAPTVEAIATIGAAHRRFGTTGFLPTLISGDFATVERGMRAVREAIEQGIPGVLGIHVEGPFLNQDHRGIHPAARLCQVNDEWIELLTSLRGGNTLVTLAPEVTGLETVRRLHGAGVKVAIGHSKADFTTAGAAFASGASGVTHLFNGMPALLSREPGIVGAVLEDESVWAGIIVDGHHVDPAVLRIALRAGGCQRFMLVTDAMPSVGSAIREFSLLDNRITVRDGACVDGERRLAGAHLDMMQAVRNAMALLRLPFEKAIHMATAAPAAFLGMSDQLGEIAVGRRANLIRINDEFDVVDSWIDGKSAQSADS